MIILLQKFEKHIENSFRKLENKFKNCVKYLTHLIQQYLNKIILIKLKKLRKFLKFNCKNSKNIENLWQKFEIISKLISKFLQILF